MNFVSTGVKELTRRLRRQQNRHALSSARRASDRADVELGRRGWETLRSDETMAAHLEAVGRLSGEVDAANARVNELDIQLHNQEVEREKARAEHQASVDTISEERGPLQKALDEQQTHLDAHLKTIQEHGARVRALEDEAAELSRADLRMQGAGTLRARREQQLQNTAARRDAIARELADLDAARPGLLKAKEEAESELARLRTSLLALDQRASQARIALGARERAATVAIAALVKQIARIRREVGRIEERKDPAFLHLGRRLAALDRAPENAETAFAEARRRRQSYERLSNLDTAWARESRDANRQDLRIFNFVAVTAAVLAAVAFLLIFRTPSRRDWLPRKTETILSLNVNRFAEGGFARAMQSQEPSAWDEVWSGMVRKVARTPGIDVRRQVSKITRALAPAPDGGPAINYLLIEVDAGSPIEGMINTLKAGGFRPRAVHGLPIYEKDDLALAQVGPATMAVGSSATVEELIDVRLGLEQDLKSDDQFFTEFSDLDAQSAFRLVTQQPGELADLAGPFLDSALLAHCRAVGMTLDLREPVAAVFVLEGADASAAERIAASIQSTPDRVLKLQSAGPNLFIEPPSVRTHDNQVEWRFKMTQPAAREFLERISRLGSVDKTQAVAAAAP